MEKNVFFALLDEYLGIGETLEEAEEDLNRNYRDNIDFDSITFYTAKKIKVERKLILVNGN